VSILLAAVFMLITMGIAVYAIFSGTAKMPRMLPDFSRLSSPFELFTAVPVIVLAFTFHFNGITSNDHMPYLLLLYETAAHRVHAMQFTPSARS
jgi:amino acid permease